MSGVGGLADILLVTQHVVCGYAQVGGWVGVQHLGGMALSTLLITLIPALSTLLITLIPPPPTLQVQHLGGMALSALLLTLIIAMGIVYYTQVWGGGAGAGFRCSTHKLGSGLRCTTQVGGQVQV